MTVTRCEPDYRQTPTGVLASTPRDHPYRIGVLGTDREEAKRRFDHALDAWTALNSRRGASVLSC